MESSIPVVVSCSNHGSVVTNGLRKLFETQLGTDLVFRWGGNSVRAHKLILEMFLTPETLAQGCHDDGKEQVQPPEAPGKGLGQSVHDSERPSILYSVFEFMYNGIVTLASEKLPELLQLAKELDFYMLVDAVESVSTSEDGREALSPQPAVILSCVDGDISEDETMAERPESPLEKRVRPTRFRVAAKVVNAADDEKEVCSEELEVMPHAELVWGEELLENGPTATTDAPAEVETKCLQANRRKRRKSTVAKNRVRKVSKKGGAVESKADVKCMPLLKCTHCDYTSRNQTLFQVHQAKHGSTVTAFRCTVCSQAFLNQASLDRHSTRHLTNIKDFAHSCPHCPYKSQQLTWFRLHLKTKHNDSSVEVYCCDTCKRPFLSASAMSHHTCVQRNGESIHACNHCEFKTSHLPTFRRHLAQHDSSNSAAVATTTFPCDICNQTFSDPASRSKHRMEHAPLKCPHCPYEARKPAVYHRHLLVVHHRNERDELLGEDYKKFGCPDCPYRNDKLSQLKIHQEAKHSAVHPYKCDQCRFTSGRKVGIYRHVKWVHLGWRQEASYMCELCGRRFVTPGKLAEHKILHTDQKPHTCELCGKSFRYLNARRRHLLRHASDDKPFCCHICGFSCNRQDNLRGHMRRIHKATLDSQPKV